MPLGAGFCPAGFSLAGFGSPDLASAPVQSILIDSATGTPQNARKIDPALRQYVLDSRGRPDGMNSLRQKVILAIKTTRNSSAVRNFGRRAPADAIGRTFKKDRENNIREALRDLTDARLLEILSFDVDLFKPTGAYELLRWRDLTTGEEHKTPL